MRRLGVSLAMTGALLAGCGTSSESLPNHTAEASTSSSAASTPAAPSTYAPTLPPALTYEQSLVAVQLDFQKTKGYWISHGVNLSATQLDIVEGNQSVKCGTTFRATDLGAAYCHAIRKLFVTQSFLTFMDSDSFFPRSAHEIPREEVLVAHEEGHNVQDIRGGIPLLLDYQKNPVKYELQADCYAGRVVRAISPQLAKIVLSPDFVYFPGDENQDKNVHGTTDQRRADFVAGFRGSACVLNQ